MSEFTDELVDASKIIVVINDLLMWFNKSKPGLIKSNSLWSDSKASKPGAIIWLNNSGWDEQTLTNEYINSVSLDYNDKNKILQKYVHDDYNMTFTNKNTYNAFWNALFVGKKEEDGGEKKEDGVEKEDGGEKKAMPKIKPFVSISGKRKDNKKHIQITFQFEEAFHNSYKDLETSYINYKTDNGDDNLYSRIKTKVSYYVRDLVKNWIVAKEAKEAAQDDQQGQSDALDDWDGNSGNSGTQTGATQSVTDTDVQTEIDCINNCLELAQSAQCNELIALLQARKTVLTDGEEFQFDAFQYKLRF